MTTSRTSAVPPRTIEPSELASPVLPYLDVLACIMRDCQPLSARQAMLGDALGRVLARDVRSPLDVPGFDNSAVDGFAVRSEDLARASIDAPVCLRVVGSVRAGGTDQARRVEAGEAIAIATGAPLPAGADAVVPWEVTSVADGHDAADDVDVRAQARAGAVRPRAEDVAAGDVLLAAGVRLGAPQLGSLAAAGVATVLVVPAPRVAVLSTGDELAPLGAQLGAGQRHDANSTLVAALVRQAGCEVGSVATLPDDPAAIALWLAETARSHDLVITSGGASVGRHDWLRHVIERDGSIRAWRAAIKPGKPIAFGAVHGTAIFALPGNPASVVVATHVFVAPYLRALAGRRPHPATRSLQLADAVAGDAERVTFHPVRIEGKMAIPLPTRTSQVISTYAAADALAEIAVGGLPAGASVDARSLRPEEC